MEQKGDIKVEKFHDKEGAGPADEAAKKRECTEYVLQVIMGKKDLRVLEQVIQKDYKNLQGRSAPAGQRGSIPREGQISQRPYGHEHPDGRPGF